MLTVMVMGVARHILPNRDVAGVYDVLRNLVILLAAHRVFLLGVLGMAHLALIFLHRLHSFSPPHTRYLHIKPSKLSKSCQSALSQSGVSVRSHSSNNPLS